MSGPQLVIEPSFFVGAMAVLGLLIGSFLNVVIHRLPRMMEREWRHDCRELLELAQSPDEGPTETLVKPRSRCPACSKLIAWYDNIPVLSYLVLRGRCRNCGSRISARYPLIELVSGILAAACAWQFGVESDGVYLASAAAATAAAVLCWYLVALAMIDYDTTLLPDSMTMPLLWGGILLGNLGWFVPDLASAVYGAVFGYLALWSVYWLFKLITGKEGMGYGDFKLLAALGAWFGWQALPNLILLSAVVGAVIGLGLIATGIIKRSQPIPFGPYLALAGIVSLFWGDVTGMLLSSGSGL